MKKAVLFGILCVIVIGASVFFLTGCFGNNDQNDTDPRDQVPLTINAVTGKIYGMPDFTLTTTGGSGTGAVTFTLQSGDGIATVSEQGVVSIIMSGDIVVRATKAADNRYRQTTSENLTISIGRATQEVPTGVTLAVDFIGAYFWTGRGIQSEVRVTMNGGTIPTGTGVQISFNGGIDWSRTTSQALNFTVGHGRGVLDFDSEYTFTARLEQTGRFYASEVFATTKFVTTPTHQQLFEFNNDNGTITRMTTLAFAYWEGRNMVIPNKIGDVQVIRIADNAFRCTYSTLGSITLDVPRTVTFPSTITHVGSGITESRLTAPTQETLAFIFEGSVPPIAGSGNTRPTNLGARRYIVPADHLAVYTAALMGGSTNATIHSKADIDSNGFLISNNQLMAYFGNESVVVIPSGVTHVADVVFRGHLEITSVVIPASVTNIRNTAFAVRGSWTLPTGFTIFYQGTQTQWQSTDIVNASGNPATLSNDIGILFYSTTSIENGWRFVDNIPTKW